MELFFLPSLLFTLFILQVNVMESADVETPKKFDISSKSCVDYLRKGYKSDGFYDIYDFNTNKIITVYCDLTSEPGSAWTLVMSFALKNRLTNSMNARALLQNVPINEQSPNWGIYRMSHSQMNYLKSQSTHWRATCSYPTNKVDYRDYVRAKISDFDVMTFTGNGICKKVEFVNIRGHQCAQCTSKWWQVLGAYAAHIDSYATGCDLNPSTGSVVSEDNFGFYGTTNNKFRCTENQLSTTNWWFGAYK
ncbi:uncharacterized protein LOC124442668 [Xenia sp. Carnegie-2017]|uniref:uncharacterized protein LOC124442668 n=1 Tax=Xenia sp. Carnegie-2017 TaxID=2897299 RepID=UPI001F046E86|nr:uncharacterized protein LOC124442668 [Xenia sp. Carnegie-2017]